MTKILIIDDGSDARRDMANLFTSLATGKLSDTEKNAGVTIEVRPLSEVDASDLKNADGIITVLGSKGSLEQANNDILFSKIREAFPPSIPKEKMPSITMFAGGFSNLSLPSDLASRVETSFSTEALSVVPKIVKEAIAKKKPGVDISDAQGGPATPEQGSPKQL